MAQEKILIVEDELLIALEIESRMEKFGYKVCAKAVNADEALSAVKNNNPDLILLDIKIDGAADGIETAKQILAIADIPIIFLTAYADEKTVDRAKVTMPYGYLSKPVQEKDLRIAVEMALYKSKFEKELRRTQEELKQSEHRNRTLVNALPDLIFRVSQDGTILDYSTPTIESLILPPELFLNRKLTEILPEAITTVAVPAIKKSIENNSIESFEYEIPIGLHLKSYEARSTRLKENEALVVARDVTEIKIARDAVLESEKRYRLIAENSNDLIYVYNLIPEPHYEYISPSCELLTGYKPEEGYADPYVYHKFLVEPEDLEKFNSYLFAKPAPDKPIIERWRKKDGTFIWVEQVLSRNFDETGNLVSFQSTVRDITQRKQMEYEIFSAKQRIEMVVTSSTVLLYACKASGNFDATFISSNIFTITGYTKEEFLSKGFWANHIHPEDSPKVFRDLSYLFENNYHIHEYRFMFKDGSYHWMLDELKLIRDESGNPLEMIGSWADISVRKKTEIALAESEERFRSLYNNSTIGLYRTTPDGKILLANHALVKMLGYDSFEDLAKRNLEKDGYASSRPRNEFKKILNEQDQAIGLESEWMREDGTPIFARECAKTIRDERGNVIYYDGTVEDITVRKQAEQLLYEKNELLERVYATTHFCLVYLDSKFNFIRVNKAYAQACGCPEEFFNGKNHFQLYPHKENEAIFNEVVKTGKPFSILAKPFSFPDHPEWGVTYWDWTLHPIKDNKGIVEYLLFALLDVTKQKLAEKKLMESEERYRLLAESSPEMIYLIDSEGYVKYVNSAAAAAFRSNAEELIGKQLIELFPPDTAKTHFEDILNVFETKKSAYKEVKDEFPIGTKWLEARLSPIIDQSGNVAAVMGLSFDITERKLAEEALIKSEERYKRITEGLTDYLYSVIIKEKKVVETIHNEACLAVTGYTTKEFTTNPHLWINMVVPEEREIVAGRFQKLLDGKDISVIEHRIICKNGKIRWISDTTIPKYDSNGTLVSYDGVIKDITERKNSEEVIKKFAEKYLAIQSNELFGFWLVNENGIIEEVNDEYLSLSGYSKEEMINHEVSKFDAIDDSELVHKRMERIFIIGKELFETKHRKKDGTTFTVEISLIFLQDQKKFICFIRDITERKTAEEALKQSEIKYRTVADYTYDWEYWTDTHDDVIYMSPSVEKITGYKLEEFIKDPELIDKIVHPDDLDIWLNHLKERNSDEYKFNPLEVEFRINRKDGDIRWIQHICRNIFNENGENLGVRASNRDITENKASEELIIKLSTAVEQSPLSVIITDIKGKMEYVNPKCCEMTGYELTDLIGCTPRIFQSGQTKKEKYADLWETILNGNVWKGELLNKRKNGELYWEYIIISPVHDSANKLKNFLAVKEDITERKKNENELREYRERLEEIVDERTTELRQNEEKFRALSENSEDTIVRFNRELQHLYVNPIVEKQTGIKTEEFIGKTHQELGFPEDLILLREKALENVFQNKEKNRIEFQLANGTWIDWILIPELEENGEVQTVITSGRDITKLKEYEDQIEKALQKEKELNELKNRFISTVSHEFRTPLASILSSTQLIKRYSKKWGEEKLNEHHERIRYSVKNLTELLDDILAISKSENQTKRKKSDIANLEEELNQIIGELKPLLTENHTIEFIYNIKDRFFNFDKKSFKLVFTNLLSNAIKYCPQGGHIKLLVSKVNKDILFEISDDGMGIDENELPNIFDPFFRAKKSEHIKGSGLGLSIVKHAVEQYNGTITADSKTGKGTTFKIKVPLKEIQYE